jgi:hypothetical protein
LAAREETEDANEPALDKKREINERTNSFQPEPFAIRENGMLTDFSDDLRSPIPGQEAGFL